MSNPTHILIAEDDENDRFLLELAFARLAIGNVSVTFVEDGEQAIAQLDSGLCPVLLVLDLKMPRVDGFQVLEWLAQNPSRRPPVVSAFSSSGDPKDVARARALGADSYLVKPHNPEEYIKLARGLHEQAVKSAAPVPN